MSKLNYGINDKPKKWYEWIVFSLQQLLSIFVATVLIADICHTPISSCLLGACMGTLIYQVITKFKSPMFISSCGATVSAVLGALSTNGAEWIKVEGIEQWSQTPNYLMVFCGGLVILAIYGIFALVVKLAGVQTINKIFPPVIVGPVTMVIGLNLAKYIFSYVGGTTINGIDNVPWLEVIVAIITMLIVAITSHYGKKFLKQIPFLVGLLGGYIVALCFGLVDFSAFNKMEWYPELTFLEWSSDDWSWVNLGKTILYFVPVGICALLEHYSDHKTLSNIIGTDLTVEPGLDKTLLGDGIASALGTAVCGLPNTSYGESIATTGFSRVASTAVITVAACVLGVMSFIGPITAFIKTIPACVFGGLAMILYGYISLSGLNTLISNKVSLTKNKNMIIIAVILTTGVSGIYLFDAAFKGVALAMVLGVILNLVLKEKKED